VHEPTVGSAGLLSPDFVVPRTARLLPGFAAQVACQRPTALLGRARGRSADKPGAADRPLRILAVGGDDPL